MIEIASIPSKITYDTIPSNNHQRHVCADVKGLHAADQLREFLIEKGFMDQSGMLLKSIETPLPPLNDAQAKKVQNMLSEDVVFRPVDAGKLRPRVRKYLEEMHAVNPSLPIEKKGEHYRLTITLNLVRFFNKIRSLVDAKAKVMIKGGDLPRCLGIDYYREALLIACKEHGIQIPMTLLNSELFSSLEYEAPDTDIAFDFSALSSERMDKLKEEIIDEVANDYPGMEKDLCFLLDTLGFEDFKPVMTESMPGLEVKFIRLVINPQKGKPFDISLAQKVANEGGASFSAHNLRLSINSILDSERLIASPIGSWQALFDRLLQCARVIHPEQGGIFGYVLQHIHEVRGGHHPCAGYKEQLRAQTYHVSSKNVISLIRDKIRQHFIDSTEPACIAFLNAWIDNGMDSEYFACIEKQIDTEGLRRKNPILFSIVKCISDDETCWEKVKGVFTFVGCRYLTKEERPKDGNARIHRTIKDGKVQLRFKMSPENDGSFLFIEDEGYTCLRLDTLSPGMSDLLQLLSTEFLADENNDVSLIESLSHWVLSIVKGEHTQVAAPKNVNAAEIDLELKRAANLLYGEDCIGRTVAFINMRESLSDPIAKHQLTKLFPQKLKKKLKKENPFLYELLQIYSCGSLSDHNKRELIALFSLLGSPSRNGFYQVHFGKYLLNLDLGSNASQELSKKLPVRLFTELLITFFGDKKNVYDHCALPKLLVLDEVMNNAPLLQLVSRSFLGEEETFITMAAEKIDHGNYFELLLDQALESQKEKDLQALIQLWRQERFPNHEKVRFFHKFLSVAVKRNFFAASRIFCEDLKHVCLTEDELLQIIRCFSDNLPEGGEQYLSDCLDVCLVSNAENKRLITELLVIAERIIPYLLPKTIKMLIARAPEHNRFSIHYCRYLLEKKNIIEALSFWTSAGIAVESEEGVALALDLAKECADEHPALKKAILAQCKDSPKSKVVEMSYSSQLSIESDDEILEGTLFSLVSKNTLDELEGYVSCEAWERAIAMLESEYLQFQGQRFVKLVDTIIENVTDPQLLVRLPTIPIVRKLLPYTKIISLLERLLASRPAMTLYPQIIDLVLREYIRAPDQFQSVLLPLLIFIDSVDPRGLPALSNCQELISSVGSLLTERMNRTTARLFFKVCHQNKWYIKFGEETKRVAIRIAQDDASKGNWESLNRHIIACAGCRLLDGQWKDLIMQCCHGLLGQGKGLHAFFLAKKMQKATTEEVVSLAKRFIELHEIDKAVALQECLPSDDGEFISYLLSALIEMDLHSDAVEIMKRIPKDKKFAPLVNQVLTRIDLNLEHLSLAIDYGLKMLYPALVPVLLASPKQEDQEKALALLMVILAESNAIDPHLIEQCVDHYYHKPCKAILQTTRYVTPSLLMQHFADPLQRMSASLKYLIALVRGFGGHCDIVTSHIELFQNEILDFSSDVNSELEALVDQLISTLCQSKACQFYCKGVDLASIRAQSKRQPKIVMRWLRAINDLNPRNAKDINLVRDTVRKAIEKYKDHTVIEEIFKIFRECSNTEFIDGPLPLFAADDSVYELEEARRWVDAIFQHAHWTARIELLKCRILEEKTIETSLNYFCSTVAYCAKHAKVETPSDSELLSALSESFIDLIPFFFKSDIDLLPVWKNLCHILLLILRDQPTDDPTNVYQVFYVNFLNAMITEVFPELLEERRTKARIQIIESGYIYKSSEKSSNPPIMKSLFAKFRETKEHRKFRSLIIESYLYLFAHILENASDFDTQHKRHTAYYALMPYMTDLFLETYLDTTDKQLKIRIENLILKSAFSPLWHQDIGLYFAWRKERNYLASAFSAKVLQAKTSVSERLQQFVQLDFFFTQEIDFQHFKVVYQGIVDIVNQCLRERHPLATLDACIIGFRYFHHFHKYRDFNVLLTKFVDSCLQWPTFPIFNTRVDELLRTMDCGSNAEFFLIEIYLPEDQVKLIRYDLVDEKYRRKPDSTLAKEIGDRLIALCEAKRQAPRGILTYYAQRRLEISTDTLMHFSEVCQFLQQALTKALLIPDQLNDLVTKQLVPKAFTISYAEGYQKDHPFFLINSVLMRAKMANLDISKPVALWKLRLKEKNSAEANDALQQINKLFPDIEPESSAEAKQAPSIAAETTSSSKRRNKRRQKKS